MTSFRGWISREDALTTRPFHFGIDKGPQKRSRFARYPHRTVATTATTVIYK